MESPGKGLGSNTLSPLCELLNLLTAPMDGKVVNWLKGVNLSCFKIPSLIIKHNCDVIRQCIGKGAKY